MKKFDSIQSYNSNTSSVVTIGTFDGVHIGHRKIIDNLTEQAAATGLNSVILTFFPHPRMVLQKDVSIKLLNTIKERTDILSETGLDHLIVHPFTKDFSRLTAIEFVRDVLVNQLKTKKIIIGYDHRFGRNRTADINDLIEFGKTFDFEVEQISAEALNDVAISSTKIRNALHNDGDVAKANSYLGYEYTIEGTVIVGKGLGRTIQFPTANIAVKESYKLIPKDGVYLVSATLNSEKVYGMTNIGQNPTVSDEDTKKIETYFFDFDADLYGKEIELHFLKRLRNEVKFESVAALKEQLTKDKLQSLDLIKAYHNA
ncbi:bifunctional riboflavin kinase/FAD synthetase [Spongiivirga citrea]|uniref:Riboflavin biosynthesis protein n=1 Tax=Spongiivirga citrea TaxID=1481457 RepID=A0A6M0CM15_9FLAO|nr:bifunctional riboflavin kinase/FAD synthetase [Spongiivirga citrea]NER18003.1 bifunctional riboflavin kinase/FAD synthetase [Spongiivirga citrea]